MDSKPLSDLFKPFELVFRLAGSGKLVILAVEDDHFGGNPFIFQCRKELISFPDRTAVVFVAVDDQGRRSGIADVPEG